MPCLGSEVATTTDYGMPAAGSNPPEQPFRIGSAPEFARSMREVPEAKD